MDDAKKSQSRIAGRGVVWISIAKIYFVLAGLALISFLPRFIGSNDIQRARLYGDFSVIIGLLNPITMMMIAGTIQAVSKFISEDERRFGLVKSQALKLQMVIGGAAASIFFLMAPAISGWLGDSSLTPYLRIASVIIFCYAIYAALIGCFNGRKMFFHQAAMDIVFASLKIALILGFAAAGFGVAGAVGGFALTAAIMTFLALFMVGDEEKRGSISWRDILRFEAWIMIFALVSNLLMNVDLYLVKALGPGDVQTGMYSVALQISRLPYIAIISVTFVIFPLLSSATYKEDIKRSRQYIAVTGRYALILVISMAGLLSAISKDLLTLIFPDIFHDAWIVLAILPWAYVGYSMFAIFTTMISASGSPKYSAAFAVFSLLLAVVFLLFALENGGIESAAVAELLAMLFAGLCSGYYLFKRFQVTFDWLCLSRLLIISAIIWFFSSQWYPSSPWLIVSKFLGLGLMNLFLLVLTRTLSYRDLELFREVISRRSS